MKYNGYYIDTTPDCGENEGGYYCTVFADPDCTCEIDSFCVYADDIKQNPDIEHWVRAHLAP